MSKTSKAQSNVRVNKIGFWTMIRDVLIAALNKGQFPLAMLGVIVIVMVMKMPGEDVSKLANKLLDGFRDYTLVGWFSAPAALLAWALHAKLQRSQWTQEMDRVTNERNRLQERLLGKSLESSNQ